MHPRTRELVRERAHRCSEYCRLPERADVWPFHLDHILARVHGGTDDPENLCWSCTQCNLHKASNFASVDPGTGDRVYLFNPRQDSWDDHFNVEADGRIVGLTAAGRATVRLLDMNGTPQLALRRELIRQREYPLD